jgi:hypothetical protein
LLFTSHLHAQSGRLKGKINIVSRDCSETSFSKEGFSRVRFAEGWEKFKVALASSHPATTSGDTTFRLHFPHHKIYGIVDTHFQV